MAHSYKVKDIHDETVTEAFDRLTEEDLVTLLKKRDSFTETGCPACLSDNTTHQFEYQGLPYKRCHDCETLYISPAPSEEQHLEYVVNSSAMRYWRENMPESMKKGRLPMYAERVDYALAAFEKYTIVPQKTLEFGAGNGEFATELAARTKIKQITLLEPQELNLPDERIKIIQSGFDGLAQSTETYDVVFAWEVIEHFLEPDNFLSIARKALKPEGLLILSTPNENSTETRTLSTASSNILFDHVRLYNPKSMRILLERNGFEILELTTPGKLDVERIRTYLKANPDHAIDPFLKLIMQTDAIDDATLQNYIVENELSSHMRAIAIPKKGWKALVKQSKANDNQAAPTTFNKVVIPKNQPSNNPYPAKLMRYILNDIAGFTSGKMVDLGGGWGHYTQLAKELGFDAISVDREAASQDTNHVICDISKERLPFEDQSVDVIFSKSVIEHFYIHELPHVMGEARRVLKPGGAFVVLTPDWEFNTKQFYHIFTHVTPYTKSSLKQCLTMYGFSDAKTLNIMQLPETWHNPMIHMLVNFLGHIPLPRSWGKTIRWSQEKLLVGVAYKREK